MLDQAWRLGDSVAARPESFGAVLYDYQTRRLSLVASAPARRVLDQLGTSATVREALTRSGVSGPESEAVLGGLAALADGGFLVTPAGMPCRSDEPASPAGMPRAPSTRLADRLESGLSAPICLTWELTYGCNLSCTHCLSSSGRRDPNELSTQECLDFAAELGSMGVFYVNIGGGEPTIRPDFWDILAGCLDHRVGVKFSTNGSRIDTARAEVLAGMAYVDVQVSLDGATAEVNDKVRGAGSFDTAVRALDRLASAGKRGVKVSVVCTRHNIGQLDAFLDLANRYQATLRLTRLRPAGRGAETWADMHPLPDQQRVLYDWLLAHGERVLTGDSFFHLSAYGQALPGLNMCGAGRVVCLVDPVGDVYACPFAMHDSFLAGSLRDNGFGAVWRESPVFEAVRGPQASGCTSCPAFSACRGGCMAAKFFTGLPLNGPDPECVRGEAEPLLAARRDSPAPSRDHSHSLVRVTLGRRPRDCEPSPLATAGTRAP
ncbi:MAG: mycofactocin radical SAM maturase [Dermatophilaceae bacterium]